MICKLYIISNIIKDHGKQNFVKGKVCQNQLVKFRIDSLISFYPINISLYTSTYYALRYYVKNAYNYIIIINIHIIMVFHWGFRYIKAQVTRKVWQYSCTTIYKELAVTSYIVHVELMWIWLRDSRLFTVVCNGNQYSK